MTTNAEFTTSTTGKTVDASLWWEPFADLITELENAAPSSSFTESLEKELKVHHTWFLETVLKFKKSNKKSREALDSPQLRIGEHVLNVDHELREAAIKISSILCLDEVQSYILVKRSLERNISPVSELDFLDLVIVDYYTERQCLLKCTRQILELALYFLSESKADSAVLDEAHSLVNDGLEGNLLSVLEGVLSSNHPSQMDVDMSILWYEETLAEDKLILDILFLIYYESFSTCDIKCWKRLYALYEGIFSGSYHIQKRAVTPEAVRAIYLSKVQLLLILIEALNLENLLQMMHDNVPLSGGSIGFSEDDILQMDGIVSSLNAFQANEIGPLTLSWAVFLSLLTSLPGKEELKSLTELDHIGYSRQAFEVSSLEYFLEILDSDILKCSDGPVAGYWSVLRSFISAFLTSYEINLKFGDDNSKLILEILSKIYRGEESLCVQFWDKDSYIDGPVRFLLCNLESEFPFRTGEFVSLLSALCEGAWPTDCVYAFLHKSVGISTPFKVSRDSPVDNLPDIVETSVPLSIPGFEGLVIPSKTRGKVLRMIDENYLLVRWEYRESGVLFLVLRLAQGLYTQNVDELIDILDLFSRLVNFSLGACYSLMVAWTFPHEDTYANGIKEISVDLVEILCMLLKGLPPSVNATVIMSLGIKILAKMLICSPSHVAAIAMNSNIFGVAFELDPFDANSNSLSSGSWLLTGRLSKMILIDCEENDCSLTLSVLDFTINLLEIGAQNDIVLALVVFSLQYVLVNHELWKYKVKHARWKVTLKVFEVVKKCVWSSSRHQKMWQSLHDILFSDSSIHSVILRIICTTTPILEKLSLSRLFDTLDIEGLHLALSSGLDVLADMISSSKDSPSLAVFRGGILSPTIKPVPVVTAAISFISYFRNSMIQIRAARLLAALFDTDSSEGLIYSNTNLGLSDMQVSSFKKSISRILSEQSLLNEDLVVAVMQLLSAAASNQPVFINLVFMSNGKDDGEVCDPKRQPNEFQKASSNSKKDCIFSAILLYLTKSEDLLHRKPKILLCILNFLREIWQGAPKFLKILELLKGSDGFWRHVTYSVLVTSDNYGRLSDKLTEMEFQEVAYRYQFLSSTLEILTYEIFLQKKLMHAKLVAKRTSRFSNSVTGEIEDSETTKDFSLHGLKDIFFSWCKGPIFSNLIKACASWDSYKSTHFRAKLASSLVAVDIMLKVRTGDFGSLSVSLINIMNSLEQKLFEFPAFLELQAQYAQRGYSQRQELENLILNDLFYQIRGEFEGRQIDNKLFKDLRQFLIDSEIFAAYKFRQDDVMKSVYLYDTAQLRTDMGFEMMDLLGWQESKEAGETMLLLLQHENSSILCMKSKLQALRGLTALLHLTDAEGQNDDHFTVLNKSKELISSSIDDVCQCLHETVESLTPDFDVSQDVMDTLEAQAELLLLLLKNVGRNISQNACVYVLRTSGHCLKVLCTHWPSTSAATTTEILLMLIISSAEFLTGKGSLPREADQIEYIDGSAEASNASLGLLPVLCGCVARTDYLTLSLACVDSILKGFSKPSTWFPILQRHLPLQLIVHKLQDNASPPSVISVVLKFLLKIARVRQGAEMLLNVGILEYLRILLGRISDGWPSSSPSDTGGSFSRVFDRIESNQPLWGLCLSVLTAVIQSVDISSPATVLDYIMTGVLVEKAPLVSHHFGIPQDNDQSRRASAMKPSVSLSDLKETQSTWVLICVLAKDGSSWKKVSQSMESQLREKSIHLLALISKATKRDAPLLCPPVLREEFEWHRKPSFINSQNGWFAVAPLAQRDQSNDVPTHFSDLVSIEVYKIGFLLLKFLCIQAESAGQKAEDIGYVDLAHFPELPMPDILHGLQDQGMAIITELCGANSVTDLERQQLCLLLWHITLMALYLEFCVIQICGIRPVLGRVETLAGELRLLFRATEGHGFLKEALSTLRHIVSFMYPELLHHEALI